MRGTHHQSVVKRIIKTSFYVSTSKLAATHPQKFNEDERTFCSKLTWLLPNHMALSYKSNTTFHLS